MASTSVTSPLPNAALPLAGRTAIITGASQGIGRAVAIHLAGLGANIVINYIASTSTAAAELAAHINFSQLPIRAITFLADVSDAEGMRALFDHAEQAFGGKVHILVNCAGVQDSKYPTVAATEEDDWDKTFSVNAKGSFLCCREAANRIVRGGGGRIIMFSSSKVGSLSPGYGAYTASKAAVEAMVKILAKELRGAQITANCVAPGPIATELFFAGKSEEQVKMIVGKCPLGRLGETGDVAPVVGFLARDSSEWINGQVIRLNGGYI